VVVVRCASQVGGSVEQLSIGGRLIGLDMPPYIVAEIGANHNGDMDLCRRMIDAAAEAGAEAVKFQSWSKSSLISRAEYERNTRYASADPATLGLEQAVERYQLSADQHRVIADHCRQRGVVFFSSCFSTTEVDLLETLEAPAYKIASMDVTHLPLLEYVARTGRPVLMSTGMATLGEIERALEVLRKGGAGPIALLHCLSLYPSPPAMVNLRNIDTLRRAFDVPVGYSDHTLGVSVPLAAVALGACVLEKHFTTDKTLPGWDHAISADPPELLALVEGSRAVFAALGSAARSLAPAELEKRKVFRRRMVARYALRTGHRIGPGDVDFKRPGTGIGPEELRYVVGRVLLRDVPSDGELEWTDFG
jgi:N,N'-diacetyllegionaminate synthase